MIAALALMAALAPGPVAIRFQPPLDRTLRYEVVESRVRPGGTMRFSMTVDVRFTAAGGGYRMTWVQTATAADATPRARMIFEAGMKPFEGVPTTILVARDGEPGAVLDAEAVWARIAHAQGRMLDALAKSGTRDETTLAAIRTQVDGLSKAPPAEREALIREWGWELLAFTAPGLQVGETVALENGGGTMTLAEATATSARFLVERGEAGLRTSQEAEVSRETGLLARSRLTTRAANGTMLGEKRIMQAPTP